MSQDIRWTVKMRCTVSKTVTCENCTEEQAREKPFEFSTDEMETDQIDWEVLSVEEDK